MPVAGENNQLQIEIVKHIVPFRLYPIDLLSFARLSQKRFSNQLYLSNVHKIAFSHNNWYFLVVVIVTSLPNNCESDSIERVGIPILILNVNNFSIAFFLLLNTINRIRYDDCSWDRWRYIFYFLWDTSPASFIFRIIASRHFLLGVCEQK